MAIIGRWWAGACIAQVGVRDDVVAGVGRWRSGWRERCVVVVGEDGSDGGSSMTGNIRSTTG